MALMEFSVLARSFDRMESTTKRLELTQILVELFQETHKNVIAKIVYLLQGKLRPEFEGVELGVAEKMAIKAISKSSGIHSGVIEKEYHKKGDLGRASSAILEQKTQTTFMAEDITVERVYDTLFKIARLEGHGSQDMKIKYISSLLNDADPLEACYILKILLGTLRLGIAEHTVMDALSIAFTGDKANKDVLEHAYNVSSDLGRVAQTVATEGLDGVNSFEIILFNPVMPMLADRVRSKHEAMEKMSGGSGFVAEYKLDGERVQIHIDNGKVMLFSRSLEEISGYYPDIVERISEMISANTAILEAEAVAVNEKTGAFLPFQELMHRRRKYKIEKAVTQYPIAVNFFDVLYFNSESCLDMSYKDRRRVLEKIVQDTGDFSRHIPMTPIKGVDTIEEFLESGINAGSEGLMLKTLDGSYRAGSRGSNWLKLKREYQNDLGDSLDLVVIGGFFGKGRRTGIYGTLLLAAYDPVEHTFTSICKVGTGFTDEILDQLYQILHPKVSIKRDPRIDSEMEADVWFDPELVIEVVASEITLSPVHRTAMDKLKKGAGMALRFPKFTGKVREEKAPEDATTSDEVVAMYRGQTKSSSSGDDAGADETVDDDVNDAN